MTVELVQDAATSPELPAGVALQPRRFAFDDLDAVPQYWFAGNPILTHFENAFSILIPPGERFFVASVRHYLDRVPPGPHRDVVEAFTQQEDLHSQAHDELNASFARFGVDVDRQAAYAQAFFDRLARILPPWMQLGLTAFAEHLTAVAAHLMFTVDEFDHLIDPQMLAFWQWHSVEELEHKSVAFDLFGQVAGGYLRRVTAAVVAGALTGVAYGRVVRGLMRDDPHRPTRAERRAARKVHLRLAGAQVKLVAVYFRPGFHPWDLDDRPYLREWYAATAPA